MTDESKKKAKKFAKTGARTAKDIVVLILKIVGAVLLTALTTGIIFTGIFAVYIKTNIASELDIRLEDYGMNLSSVIYYIDPETGREEELVTLQSTEFRSWANYDTIPKFMEYGFVAIEDQRFYKHQGVDWYRTAGAFVNMFMSMKNTFGGSTITQQLIKNLTEEDDVTVQRKLTEIFRALELEKNYEKDEIVELYLNLVYFGHGRYGVGAAAQYYFGKDVSALSLAECASIIGITNNPSIYSPYVSRAENKERQELILSEMRKQGYITESEYSKAVKEELVFQRGENNEYEEVVYTWFEEAVIRDVQRDLAEKTGYPEKTVNYLLFYGGYKIYATIDMEMQAKVDSIYQNLEELPETRGTSKQLQSAIIIADSYTGEIKALSGGVGEKTGNLLLNRATSTRRSPGSSIKPLSVYAPAIEDGIITPDTKYDDSESMILEGKPTYKPKNYDRHNYGIVTIRFAVQQSLNTISAQVLDDLKPSKSYRFMTETLGFGFVPEDEDYAALALGQLNYGATVREMTSAYTMFPNMGEKMETYTYSQVYDSSGTLILENKPKSVSAISERTAYWITNLLTDAVNNGTGRTAKLNGMPTAGKTGTTTEKNDRWFAGYTPYYTAVVWTGYDRPETIELKGSNANPAALIWKKVMDLVHEDLEPKEFKTPANIELTPVKGIATADYTVRCVDKDGNVLKEEITKDLAVNREMTEFAPEIEGYRVTSGGYVVTVINDDPSRNIAIFVYEKLEEEQPPTDEPTDSPPENWESPPPETTPPETATPPETTPPETWPPETTPPETWPPNVSEQPQETDAGQTWIWD